MRPPGPEPVQDPPGQGEAVSLRQAEQKQVDRNIRLATLAQVTVAIAVVLVICYLGRLVLETLMVSVLLAFMLEPVVVLLARIRFPRPLAAFVAVLLLLGIAYGGSYFFYNRAVDFADQLPRYTEKIRGLVSHIEQRTQRLQQTTESAVQTRNHAQKPLPVKVEGGSESSVITRNLGTVTEIAITVAFIPFLVYFMLSWQEHARVKTVQLFRPENRTTAYVTLGQISLMMKSFIGGNFIIGLFMSVCSVVVFGVLGLPYFYFLGFISGFLSLVPYLGVVLAILPPVAAGAGELHDTGLIIIAVTALGLHVFSMNVLYPKVIGKRLQLNPLVVTIALLVWGWLWGAMGLILAVPIVGAIKIICDHIPSLRQAGEWMGD